MKFYNSVGPNPRVVRMFIAEKGLDIPVQQVDLLGGENRQPDYLKLNPHGQTPTLELDDGSCLNEILAICEYLEETHPTPALFGSTPEERAQTRMWTRRVDLNICEPLTNGFRFSGGLPLFKNRIVTLPEAAEGLKRVAQDRLTWLNGQITGRTYLCGERFSMADIMLFVFLDFGVSVGQPLAEENTNVSAWFARIKERPSTAA